MTEQEYVLQKMAAMGPLAPSEIIDIVQSAKNEYFYATRVVMGPEKSSRITDDVVLEEGFPR